MAYVAFWITLAAAGLTGLLAGASLDQSIKQLPARHRIGIQAYSDYSQASDLGNGILLYAVLGVGSAVLTIVAGVAVHVAYLPASNRLPADLAAALAILHSLATTRAAPRIFAQRHVQADHAALSKLFDQFARWQALRAILQVLTFGILMWSLMAIVSSI